MECDSWRRVPVIPSERGMRHYGLGTEGKNMIYVRNYGIKIIEGLPLYMYMYIKIKFMHMYY